MGLAKANSCIIALQWCRLIRYFFVHIFFFSTIQVKKNLCEATVAFRDISSCIRLFAQKLYMSDNVEGFRYANREIKSLPKCNRLCKRDALCALEAWDKTGEINLTPIEEAKVDDPRWCIAV